MFTGATTASIIVPGNKLKAGFSPDVNAECPGRDIKPVVSSLTSDDVGEEGFPRIEPCDDSSSFFIVWSFPSALGWRSWYDDRC